MDECKPLNAGIVQLEKARPLDALCTLLDGRGLHSSTFQLNLSTFRDIGGM